MVQKSWNLLSEYWTIQKSDQLVQFLNGPKSLKHFVNNIFVKHPYQVCFCNIHVLFFHHLKTSRDFRSPFEIWTVYSQIVSFFKICTQMCSPNFDLIVRKEQWKLSVLLLTFGPIVQVLCPTQVHTCQLLWVELHWSRGFLSPWQLCVSVHCACLQSLWCHPVTKKEV
jgi:hypothetical protein